MGDVILFIEDTDLKSSFPSCRICHEEEEEAESYFETPCSCSGTVKFAHRDCIQRWCDEKGNTTCEICLQLGTKMVTGSIVLWDPLKLGVRIFLSLAEKKDYKVIYDEKKHQRVLSGFQEYKPGYTTTSKPSRLIETAVTIRDNLYIGRRERGGRRNRRIVDGTESDFPECNSDADRGASCCRYLALLFSVVLLLKHTFDVVYGTDEYPFTIFTVLTLKAIGILLPMLFIIRTIAAIQSSLRHQFLESEEEDDGLEEDEQQQHLA